MGFELFWYEYAIEILFLFLFVIVICIYAWVACAGWSFNFEKKMKKFTLNYLFIFVCFICFGCSVCVFELHVVDFPWKQRLELREMMKGRLRKLGLRRVALPFLHQSRLPTQLSTNLFGYTSYIYIYTRVCVLLLLLFLFLDKLRGKLVFLVGDEKRWIGVSWDVNAKEHLFVY